jgi:hypothetical protein
MSCQLAPGHKRGPASPVTRWPGSLISVCYRLATQGYHSVMERSIERIHAGKIIGTSAAPGSVSGDPEAPPGGEYQPSEKGELQRPEGVPHPEQLLTPRPGRQRTPSPLDRLVADVRSGKVIVPKLPQQELTDQDYAAAQRKERRDRAHRTDLPHRSGDELPQREELRRQP